MPDLDTLSSWKRFWEHGTWWKAVLLAAAYYAIYEGLGSLVDLIFPQSSSLRGTPGSAGDVVIGTGLPILLGCVVLVLFAYSVGWLKELFAPQSVRGRGWMWVGVAVVLAINISALIALDFGKAGVPVIASWLLTGLFIGFAEETLTRGFAVNILRKAGHGEISVALISSAIFGGLHLGNVFTTTQGLGVTLIQVVYTFFFGIIMYLALRLSGTLICPILLHASTDPLLSLHAEFPSGSPLGILVGLGTYLVILTGLILMIVLIVSERRKAAQPTNIATA